MAGSSSLFQLLCANAQCLLEHTENWLFPFSRWPHITTFALACLGKHSSSCIRAHLGNSDAYHSSSGHIASHAEDFLVYT